MPSPRTLAAIVVTASLTACTHWQTVTTPLPELTGGKNPPALLRITTVDNEEFELTDPRVHHDTLIGGSLPEEIWTYIALADITRVTVKKKSLLRTAGAVALVAGLVTAVVLLCDDPDACTQALEE